MANMELFFTTVDVFTTTRYRGNPLAVVRVPASLRNHVSEDQKQKIAREFNLSETTFLHEPAEGDDVVDFDIFTPAARMSFAGHPTIGTAMYVSQHADTYCGIKKLRTIAGVIPFIDEEEAGKVTVGIPHDVYIHRARLPNPSSNISTNTVPIVSIVKGMAFGLAELPDLNVLAAMNGPLIPSADRYKREYLNIGSGWDVGYTGTFYFVDLGVDPVDGARLLRTRSIPLHEDPGTGSASAALCCYLAITENAKGRNSFHLTQGVEMGRRCDIYVTVTMKESGDGIEDVKLCGTAVKVMEGSLTVD
ncbi:hypothetical protein BKA66DRAFT_473814 [Pyrenochaeta sp. MPI-SDFR-AT-0127]|nr:hypothetical protein BKA66DRAFT_473814 [Pyrenochaeta sp. MPI-SDFR-AT-0127]